MAKRHLVRKRVGFRRLGATALIALMGTAGTEGAELRLNAQETLAKSTAPAKTLTGVVVSADGQKIGSAKVSWVASPPSHDYKPVILETVTTATDGTFRFDNPAQLVDKSYGPPKAGGRREGGAVALFVQASDGGTQFVPLPRATTDLPAMNITLSPSGMLRIPVVDPDGKPVTGIRLEATFLERGAVGDRSRQFFSVPAGTFTSEPAGPDGVCTFRSLPAVTTVRIAPVGDTFALPSYNDSRFDLDNAPTATTARQLKLIPGATVTGRVTYGPTGKPIAGIKVGAQGIADGYGSAVTDADGNYRLTRMPAGAYNIALDLKDYPDWTAKAHEAVTLTPGQALTGKDFPLIKGAMVTGRAIGPDGKGIPGIPIGIYGPAHPQSTGWVQMAETDTTGHYSLRVPAGRQYLYISLAENPEGFTLPADRNRNISVTDGQTLTVDWKLGLGTKAFSISGEVQGPDGKPVADAQVFVEPIGDVIGEPPVVVRTDASGTFRIDKQSKAVNVRARKDDAATLTSTTVTPGDSPLLKLAANALVRLSGQVTDTAGKPVPKAKVDLRVWKNGMGTSARNTTTDTEGRYTFADLWPDGNYEVEATTDGFGRKYSTRLTVHPGETMPVPVLALRAATGVAQGRVVDANGEPLPGIRLFISGQENGFKMGVTDAKGRFRFEQMVEESFEVQAQQQTAGHDPNYVIRKVKDLAAADDVTIVMMPPRVQTDVPAGAGNMATQSADAEKRKSALTGKPAPAWHPTGWVNAKGKIPTTLAGLKGKVVVLDFWGVGCGPCVAILPDVQRAAEQLAPKGVVVIGVHDSSTTPQQLAAYSTNKKLTYPMVIDAPASAEEGAWFGKTFRAYGIVGIPQAALIDRNGNVAYIGDFSEVMAHAASLIAKR